VAVAIVGKVRMACTTGCLRCTRTNDVADECAVGAMVSRMRRWLEGEKTRALNNSRCTGTEMELEALHLRGVKPRISHIRTDCLVSSHRAFGLSGVLVANLNRESAGFYRIV
jgi:hypothetical protein